MDDKQIGEVIELILKDNITKNFKPDDFIVCFNEMKKGTYGKSYDRIDVQTIFEGMYAYWHNRALEAEQMAIKRHFEAIKEPDKSEVNIEGQKKVLEILKGAIREAKETEKEKKGKEKSPRDIFIQKCLNDFDTIYDRDPVESRVGKYIMCQVTRLIDEEPETFTTPVDVTEYVTEMVRRYDSGEIKI